MPQDMPFTSPSWWPVVIYYAVSVILFILLFSIKLIVDKSIRRPLFIGFTLLVPVLCALQFCIFGHGTSFMRGFLHINVDIDYYDSIRYGALFFALLYFLAMPRNKYVRFI